MKSNPSPSSAAAKPADPKPMQVRFCRRLKSASQAAGRIAAKIYHPSDTTQHGAFILLQISLLHFGWYGWSKINIYTPIMETGRDWSRDCLVCGGWLYLLQ